MLLFINAQPSWSQTGLVKNSANPSYYSWIQTSYNAASSEESLLMQAGVFTEDINLNKDIVTSLRGGYNEGFTSDSGFTVINGKVTISSGTVTMSNVKISTLAPAANSLRDDFNASVIDASVWQVAGWAEHGGQTGAARCYAKDGFLTMEFLNDAAYYAAHGLYLSSAIQTWGTFLYGRWEARLKPSNVPGVLNSFYTIDWGAGSGTKQEIDIEFLTKSFGIGSFTRRGKRASIQIPMWTFCLIHRRISISMDSILLLRKSDGQWTGMLRKPMSTRNTRLRESRLMRPIS
jgi:hypothetical protein